MIASDYGHLDVVKTLIEMSIPLIRLLYMYEIIYVHVGLRYSRFSDNMLWMFI